MGTAKKSFSEKQGKPNASILNFFKKVDGPLQDESIFLAAGSRVANIKALPKNRSPEPDDDLEGLFGEEEERFNEVKGSVKRRKVSGPDVGGNDADLVVQDPDLKVGQERVKNGCTPPPPEIEAVDATCKEKLTSKKKRRRGPFLSDSESGGEDEQINGARQQAAVDAEKMELDTLVSKQPEEMNELVMTKPLAQEDIPENRPVVPDVEKAIAVKKLPRLKQKQKIDVKEAQAKWEQMQPSTPPPETPAESEGSSYCEGSKKTKKKTKKRAKKQKDVAVPNLMKESSSGDTKKPKRPATVPDLKKENTSVDDREGFEESGDFWDDIDDEFGDGEEAVERKWMEEQARLEAEDIREQKGEDDEHFNGLDYGPVDQKPSGEQMAASCPMCEASLDGVTPDDATRHVNSCLDGNPIALPERVPVPKKPEPSTTPKAIPTGANRFARKAAIARPGQANPFEVAPTVAATASSAFSKLMSGHAEDVAWVNAAAAEHKSRGKPAYERICPFYKIMPGFFICVDAFRYGAVQGCNAYFLSHFHSDHYIGLTSTWCHGPIYCSKVTANLIKQQLRVDPKYVVALDFEERFDIPGTQGVAITMIPANHCPGSSLFLFEKVVGKGANPKIQRILHCGDFRACPAHLAHPLLMPDVVDSITGKTKQQKIDVCYLDTTYLNPKYSFPSQEDVIKACADMCVSLKKERAEETDAWEVVKRERAGAGMTKFVTNSVIKAEDDSLAMSLTSKDTKARGRLLVVCGTYSIGKERICMGIARALDCKIWAPPGKMKICKALEDEELMSRMTTDPKEAQIHMQMLMEIRPETLQDYLNTYKPHFSRIVGFRPSGWNYRPPVSRYGSSSFLLPPPN